MPPINLLDMVIWRASTREKVRIQILLQVFVHETKRAVSASRVGLCYPEMIHYPDPKEPFYNTNEHPFS